MINWHRMFMTSSFHQYLSRSVLFEAFPLTVASGFYKYRRTKTKNYYSLVVLLKSTSSGWKIGFDSSSSIDANAERVEMFRLHRRTQMIIYSCAIRLAIRLSTNTFLDCLFVFSQFTFHRQVVKLWLIVSITREHKKGNHEKMSSAWKQVFLRRKLMFVVAFKWCPDSLCQYNFNEKKAFTCHSIYERQSYIFFELHNEFKQK